MEIYTKDQLILELRKIKEMGWIKNTRPRNVGGIGNTIEDLLGIKENNLPIPNAAEWELKTQRANTSSLTTLFHMEPSPRALKFVPRIFLLKYGWPHKEAGTRYHSNTVAEYHSDWVASVNKRIGLDEINPQPYWGFDDLFHKAGTKLINCFYVQAQVKKKDGEEYFHYNKILMLQKFSIDKFVKALEENKALVDFDARTGHNHGTKFRLRQNFLPELYEKITEI